MGDRTADGTSEGESGVEGNTAQLAGSVGSGLLDNGVDLGRAGGLRWGGHGGWIKEKKGGRIEDGGIEWSGVGSGADRTRCGATWSRAAVDGGWWSVLMDATTKRLTQSSSMVSERN